MKTLSFEVKTFAAFLAGERPIAILRRRTGPSTDYLIHQSMDYQLESIAKNVMLHAYIESNQ